MRLNKTASRGWRFVVLQDNRVACATHRGQAASPPDHHDWQRIDIENVELMVNMAGVYIAVQSDGKSNF